MKSVRDMVLSMAVIAFGASLLYGTLPNDESQDPVQEVDYEVELATAGRAAPYELVAPEGLSDSWRATSVSYRAQSDHGAVWHLGFLDPSDQYVAIEQGDGNRDKFIAKVTHQATETEHTEKINGAEWVRYDGTKYKALVQQAPAKTAKDPADAEAEAKDGGKAKDGEEAVNDAEVTTLVTGTASYAQLKKMAAALESRNQG